VARWRTRAALAAVALVAVPAAIAAAVLHDGSGSSATNVASKAARHPRLAPVASEPLRVKGTEFVPGEKVRLAVVGGLDRTSRAVTAGSSGSFVAGFPGVTSCDSVTVTAVGSRGSRASFNLSQIVCHQP
jgi:hypothetical protein